MSSVEQLEAVPAAPPPAPNRRAGRTPLGAAFWCCATWLVLVGGAAIFAPWLPLKNPVNPDYSGPNFGKDQPPSWHHLLGTDQLARDIFSRLVYGSRVSLTIALFATLIGIGIGSILAMLSAYRESRTSGFIATAFDNALILLMYSGLAFPAIIAVLAVLGFWGTITQLHLIVVLGAASVPLIFRLVRAATLSVATREYVTAARAQGATAFRVIFREILPNIMPSLIAYTVFTVGAIVGTEGGLGFIGLSVVPPTPSWGNMFNDATGDPNNLALILAPTIALFFTLIALNTVGERIRVHFDTAESKL